MYNKEDSQENDEFDLLKALLVEPKFRLARVIVLLSTLSNLIPLGYSNVLFSCQLIILQNVLAPHFCASIVNSRHKATNSKERERIGILVGTITGALPATMHTVVYFLVGRDYYFQSHAQVAPTNTFVSFFGVILAEVALWTILVIISGISGWIAVRIPIHNWIDLPKPNDQNINRSTGPDDET